MLFLSTLPHFFFLGFPISSLSWWNSLVPPQLSNFFSHFIQFTGEPNAFSICPRRCQFWIAFRGVGFRLWRCRNVRHGERKWMRGQEPFSCGWRGYFAWPFRYTRWGRFCSVFWGVCGRHLAWALEDKTLFLINNDNIKGVHGFKFKKFNFMNNDLSRCYNLKIDATQLGGFEEEGSIGGGNIRKVLPRSTPLLRQSLGS